MTVFFQQVVDCSEGGRTNFSNCWFHDDYITIVLYTASLVCELATNMEYLVPRFWSHSWYQLVDLDAWLGSCPKDRVSDCVVLLKRRKPQ